MFTRLTKDEEIPQVERVRAAPLRWAAAARRVRDGQHLAAIVFIPATAAALVSLVLVLGRGQPAPTCPPAHPRAGQQAYPARSWKVPACRAASAGGAAAGRR